MNIVTDLIVMQVGIDRSGWWRWTDVERRSIQVVYFWLCESLWHTRFARLVFNASLRLGVNKFDLIQPVLT